MKKLNKFFAVLVALAMMATLCVSMAFAEVPAGNPVDNVDITKILTKNDGTTTPTAHFAFNIEKNTDKGNSAAPAIDDKVFNFSSATATTLTDSLSTIIKNAMDTANTPNGQYAYDIYEDTANSTGNSTENGVQNTYTYSTLKYRVRVYKSTDGYKFTVSQVTTNEQGEEVETKLPATDTPGQTGQTTSTLSFENKYVKSTIVVPDGGDPDDPDTPKPETNDAAGLFVQKIVANDQTGLYDDKEFTFELKAKAPNVNTITGNKTGYAYKVVEVGTGAEVTGKSGTLIPGDGTQDATVITLTDDQRLVFTDLDVGAIINVKEADYSEDFAQTAIKNADETITSITAGENITIDEDGSKVKVTNTSENKTTPEGILISNLPYIALALVAIGGLVAYVVIRRRNADEA